MLTCGLSFKGETRYTLKKYGKQAISSERCTANQSKETENHKSWWKKGSLNGE